jgi:hypothetical protein
MNTVRMKTAVMTILFTMPPEMSLDIPDYLTHAIDQICVRKVHPLQRPTAMRQIQPHLFACHPWILAAADGARQMAEQHCSDDCDCSNAECPVHQFFAATYDDVVDVPVLETVELPDVVSLLAQAIGASFGEDPITFPPPPPDEIVRSN